MNQEPLRQQLLAAARAHPPSDAVPYAFEKRILACLASLPRPDVWTFWTQALWRAAAPCVGIMVLLGAWMFVDNSMSSSEPLAVALENTMLAVLDTPGETW